ncbi:MAG: ABC transporter permease [Chloroflexi bacterium]|nr:ABC transporter permease [Chloroflexota bacterium]
MTEYIIKRLLSLIFVVLGMSIMVFTITHAIPADPARLVAGNYASAEVVESIRERMGLHLPLPAQYLLYMKRLVLEGDLGTSMYSFRPVGEDLKERIPASLELAVFSLLLAVPLGLTLGIISATRAGGVADSGTRFFAIIGVSMPVFWSALLLQLIFYGVLEWFPSGGRLSVGLPRPLNITGLYLLDSILTGNWAVFFDSLHHIFLPALTLALGNLAVLTRMTRASVLEVLFQDYVRTARSKGLTERAVLTRHVLKNAFIPVLTVIGLQMGALIGWVFIVEVVFSWPGIGSYAVRAIMNFDFDPIMGFVIFMSFVYVLINLAVDLTYPILDPRIRY